MADLNEIFHHYKRKKIVLYGLGVETAKAIDTMSVKFNIIGLLDGFKRDGFLYGKRIMDMNQCVAENVELIIVVARPGSCRAIASKIGFFCRENSIELIDIRGNNLLNHQKNKYDYDTIVNLVRSNAAVGADMSEGTKIKRTIFENRLFEIQNENMIGSRTVCIRDAYDIGYLFCGPIITDFIIWFRMMVRKKNLKNIWFCARDGYLLKELYQMIDRAQDSKYFLTSRIAAARSCVENEDDIVFVDSMRFSGTLKENLAERFGIVADESAADDTKAGILRYGSQILDKAKNLRCGYCKYIASLDIHPGGIAFFDFVAKGTTQHFIRRLVDHHMTGLYFLQLEPDFMADKNLDVISFYTDEELDHSAVFENYYILETFLTGSKPTIVEFDYDGCPVYSEETRTASAISSMERVQLGIVDYYKSYIKQCNDLERSIDKKFDEQLLMLIHHVEIKDDEFLNLIIEDPFFNRMTNMTDVL